MKKLISILVCLSILLSCAACGGASSAPGSTLSDSVSASSSSSEHTDTDQITNDLDSFGDIDVEKDLFDVTLTIPAEYAGDTTQEDLDKDAAEGRIYSATINEDGSITYVMSKSQHKQLLSEIAAGFNEALSGMVGSDDYPNITDIKANDNFTGFTVTTTSNELSVQESFSVLGFYIYGGMYAIFSGDEADNIHVDFVNAETGEILASSDSKDME